MTLRDVEGDLFSLGLPALAHGCNCEGSMTGGIARDFRALDQRMHEEYVRRCAVGQLRPGDVLPWVLSDGTVVYNLMTQQRPGRDARLPAIRTSVAAMLEDAAQRGLVEVGVPRIGAGIGGLEWPDVRAALEAAAEGSPVRLTVVTRRP